ncbi:hypothetical protein [Micromonospora sp. NPDC050695]
MISNRGPDTPTDGNDGDSASLATWLRTQLDANSHATFIRAGLPPR